MMQAQNLDLMPEIINFFGKKNDKYIGLTPDEVRVYYTKYTNDFKPRFRPLPPGQTSIRDAVTDQLTPGKLLLITHPD